jgi:hypothetical protein
MALTVTPNTHERDGVEYLISVWQSDDGYFASWQCRACRMGGQTEHPGKTEADASLRARARLFSEHHLEAHLSPKRRGA